MTAFHPHPPGSATVRGLRLTAVALSAGGLMAGALINVSAEVAAAAPSTVAASATVMSHPGRSATYYGGDANNSLRVTRTGTDHFHSTYLFDDIVPIKASTGCLPVVGDPTRATCKVQVHEGLPRGLHILAGSGKDVITNATTMPYQGKLFDVQMTAYGEDGDDILLGGRSHDRLNGGLDLDTLKGGGGDDVMSGGPGRNWLDGGDDNDTLYGGAEADTLLGQAGNDDLDGGPGPDNLNGGAGFNDTVDYQKRTTSVSVDLTKAGGQGEKNENDTFTGIESAIGGRAGDVLSGNHLDNALVGAEGPDIIFGYGGEDGLVGGEGDDFLVSNNIALFGSPSVSNVDGKRDVVVGLAGNDTCFYSSTDNDFVDCEEEAVAN